MRVMIVGGTWGINNERPSSMVQKIGEQIKELGYDTVIHNGGSVAYFKQLIYYTKQFDVVFWWPNVPDDQVLWDPNKSIEEQKNTLRNVKLHNPKCMLIGSKNNRDGMYNFAQLITRTLIQKHNLCIEFYSKPQDKLYYMKVFDPLGNVWYDGTDIKEMCSKLMERIEFLSKITRQSTILSNDLDWISSTQEEANPLFLQLIKQYAETFHELIHPENTERMLGNCSYRCQRGFPSYRGKNCIYVSRRNVDKRYIDKDMFVPVRMNENGQIEYVGKYKPSVDTPIQVRLYNLFPKINYMIHAHCYIEDALATTNPTPCGGIEEVDEILNLFIDKTDDKIYNQNILKNVECAKINLFGHGSLIMANNIDQLSNIPYIERAIPTYIN